MIANCTEAVVEVTGVFCWLMPLTASAHSPVGDSLVLSWLIPLPDQGHTLWVLLNMAVQAVLYHQERGGGRCKKDNIAS